MVIPYSEHQGPTPHIDQCTHLRVEHTKRLIRKTDFEWPVLDVGERNWVSEQIEEYVWPHDGRMGHAAFDNTDPNMDFNDGLRAPKCGYKCILCLEVIEHVMNPLLLMRQIQSLLSPGGVCYLSTPVRNPLGFWFNESCHFAEYSVTSIETLVQYAGFEISDKDIFRSWPVIYGYKIGGGVIRTSLRVWSQKSQIYRLVAK